MQCSFI